ncbi:hypothetical protein N177_0945 [Lutibaculum baratangense AMV1]|uniref:Uncharacterized protein n=1 Tax=Lutibaculum baratangense AMV1 TaxID=631454 RepID=V4RTP0_9HYPH|nr:hypothetical protein N177_0945 [Lutibaculum baratangense AMV1]
MDLRRARMASPILRLKVEFPLLPPDPHVGTRGNLRLAAQIDPRDRLCHLIAARSGG